MLISALQQKQRELGIDARSFAAHLGISQGYWSQVQSGSRQPGVRLLNGTARRFPELLPAVLSFLQSDMAKGKRAIALRHTLQSHQTHQEGQESRSGAQPIAND